MSKNRSFTDPITNHVFLSSISLEADFNSIAKMELPPTLMPSLLHEMTHHWCYDSPVGIALVLLYLRARREAVKLVLNTQDQFNELQFVSDYFRYRFALEYLRPFNEGIAMFAECDLFPGSSRTISVPMERLYRLIAGGTKKSRTNINKKLSQYIYTARATYDFIERKASLLLDSSSPGGYLTGYLTIRNMRLGHLRKCSLFADTDFFLQYLRRFFFDDYGFVSVLLAPPCDDLSDVTAVQTYFVKRYFQFMDADHSTAAARLERTWWYASLFGSLARPIFPDVTEFDSDQAAEGRKRLNAQLAMFQSQEPVTDLDSNLLSYDRRVLLGRNLLTISRIEDAPLVFENDWVTVFSGPKGADAQPIAKSRLLAAVDRSQEATGVAELIICSRGSEFHILWLVSKDEKIISAASLNARLTPDILTFVKQSKEGAAPFEDVATLEILIKGVLERTRFQAAIKDFENRINDVSDFFFMRSSFLKIDTEQVASLRKLIGSTGVLPVFGNKIERLKAFATISAFASMNLTIADLEKIIAANFQCSLRDCIEDINSTAKQNLGAILIEFVGQNLLTRW